MIDAFRQLRFPDMLAEICPAFAAGAVPPLFSTAAAPPPPLAPATAVLPAVVAA